MRDLWTFRRAGVAAVTVLGVALGLWTAAAQTGTRPPGGTTVKPVPGILPPPDLLVDAVMATGDGVCMGGRRTFTMHVTVRNVGKGPAIMPQSKLNPWGGVHSMYAEGGGGGYRVGNPYPKVTGPDALQPGKTHVFKVDLSIPNPPPGKPYAINAVADPNNVIGESNDQNNMKSWSPSLAASQNLACPSN
jgi:CARDB protein